VIVVIPGLITLSPWLYLGLTEWGWSKFAGTHSLEFNSLTILAAIAVGLLIQVFSGYLENQLASRLALDPTRPERVIHQNERREYWGLSLENIPLGHEDLRSVTFRLRFELGIVVALPLVWSGLLIGWMTTGANGVVSGFLVLTFALFLGIPFLWRAAYDSVTVASAIRREILRGARESSLRALGAESSRGVTVLSGGSTQMSDAEEGGVRKQSSLTVNTGFVGTVAEPDHRYHRHRSPDEGYINTAPRRGEQRGFRHSRSSRFYSVGSQWYAARREGGDLGPFRSLAQAQMALASYIADQTAGEPDAMDFTLSEASDSIQVRVQELRRFMEVREDDGLAEAVQWAKHRAEELGRAPMSGRELEERLAALRYLIRQQEG
jgi:hypothetical protein